MKVTVAMGLILCNCGLESDLAKQGDFIYLYLTPIYTGVICLGLHYISS